MPSVRYLLIEKWKIKTISIRKLSFKTMIETRTKKIQHGMLLTILLCSINFFTSCEKDDDFSSKPDVVTNKFFSQSVNKLIDENYKSVQENGYAELIIPANYYDKTATDQLLAAKANTTDLPDCDTVVVPEGGTWPF